jgi:hypothetical protein
VNRSTKEALASRQEMVDQPLWKIHAAAVARGRGVSVAKVKSGFRSRPDGAWRTMRKTEGMVDRIATLEQVLARSGRCGCAGERGEREITTNEF